jgi:ERCC4-type nuclease
MTSEEGAKRKATSHPSEVIDLVDDSDTEDEGMHLLLVDKGREVINLVDDGDDEPPVLLASKPRTKMLKTMLPPWEVVLLVDNCEPVDFFNQLSQAGVTCERRRLVTFDFLWVARRCTTTTTTTTATATAATATTTVTTTAPTAAGSKYQGDEFVLGHACERKEINDLANSLDQKNKSTGLNRNAYQKLKMRNSGVENKFYIVQGKIQDLYKTHMQWAIHMGKRVHQNIKEMEEDGYTVSRFAQDAKKEIVDFLRKIHLRVESQVANKQPPDTYMTLTRMIERADWVTELGIARGALGEKKLQLILSEFPTSFKTEYNRDSAAMVQRLASLETDKRRGITNSAAQTLCTNLFGVVATEHAPNAVSVPVTPDKSLH